MNKTYKILIAVTSILAVGGLTYYLIEQRRVKKLNEKVDSLDDALKQLEMAKKGS